MFDVLFTLICAGHPSTVPAVDELASFLKFRGEVGVELFTPYGTHSVTFTANVTRDECDSLVGMFDSVAHSLPMATATYIGQAI